MTNRYMLAQLPTPLEPLTRLSAFLGGPPLYIKRDDQTGLAFGGNKTRKLEFLIADALAQKADVLLTAGAAQSNHCRQTAAAAVRAGLKCVLVLGGSAPGSPNGNLLLDQLLGAEIHWTERERRAERMEELAEEIRKEGKRPYVIPIGGSNGVGAQGYVLAMQELVAQIKNTGIHPDTIVVASSSGGTQAGMVLGAKLYGYEGKILGISIDKGDRGPERYEVELAEIANSTAEVMEVDVRVTPEDFFLDYGYLGDGYGIVGFTEREAIALMARHEGILLDPVYTGRAFGAIVKNAKAGMYGSTLFWHTGGAAALFAYGKDL
ncbi:MAG: D-cysteine desulfhydrase family protein [Bacteroidetes bacterium]|nr:D-cysteine desulfhydrase family protein [Bacteroidota bacterium]